MFTQLGNDAALTDGDVVGPAIAAEDMFKYPALNSAMGTTIRGLAKLAPACAALADDYDRRVSDFHAAAKRGRLKLAPRSEKVAQ